MTDLANNTLASIVTKNHQAVPVLEKYHLDFCCKGRRTLSEACEEKGISLESILQELAITGAEKPGLVFDELTAEELISYIIIHHHLYVKQTMPVILGHLQKVATKHGERFTYMPKVFDLFLTINGEMLLHMNKEENILFPRIREIAANANAAHKKQFAAGFIDGPVSVMEQEHDQAGSIMYNIRELTSNYTAPADACTTFRVVLAELKAFEEDLHRHVHLENNILFPLAEKLLSAS